MDRDWHIRDKQVRSQRQAKRERLRASTDSFLYQSAINADVEWYEPPNAGEPTTCGPGTIGKFEAMVARLERGEPLFHPDDVTDFANLDLQNARGLPKALGHVSGPQHRRDNYQPEVYSSEVARRGHTPWYGGDQT